MFRARALVLASLLAAAAPVLEAERVQQVERARPNVLFLAVDDLRPELGCYGAEHAASPHIDAFARTAVLFERHFVQAPSCGPSRAALLTGRSPAKSGRLGNASLYQGKYALARGELEGAQTLPEVFRRNGYRTVCIGKISHTPDGRVFAYDGTGDGRDELPGAWDELATPFGPWERGWGAFFAYAGGAHREDGGGNRALMDFSVERDDELPDGLMAGAATRKLRELAARDEPFFLGVGFFKPHLPFVAPTADREHFAGVEVPGVAVPALLDLPYGSKSGEFHGYRAPFEKSRPLGADAALEARRAYLACVRYVDRQVGAVLTALDECGLADSTIVVLWSDHGWHLGESGVWGKHTLLDRSLHAPLLVRAPGTSRAGARCGAVVETLDLFPTLVELARLEEVETAFPLDGDSLVPALRGEPAVGAGDARAYWRGMATVRTADHRLLARRGDAGSWTDVEVHDVRTSPDPSAATRVGDEALEARLLERLARE